VPNDLASIFTLKDHEDGKCDIHGIAYSAANPNLKEPPPKRRATRRKVPKGKKIVFKDETETSPEVTEPPKTKE